MVCPALLSQLEQAALGIAVKHNSETEKCLWLNTFQDIVVINGSGVIAVGLDMPAPPLKPRLTHYIPGTETWG